MAQSRIEVIKKGKPAPFDGIIYSNDAHALLVSKTKTMKLEYDLKLEYLEKKLGIDCNSKLNLLKIDKNILTKKIEIIEDFSQKQKKYLLNQIESNTIIPWYRSWQFVSVTTFLLTVGLGIFSIWGINELKK